MSRILPLKRRTVPESHPATTDECRIAFSAYRSAFRIISHVIQYENEVVSNESKPLLLACAQAAHSLHEILLMGSTHAHVLREALASTARICHSVLSNEPWARNYGECLDDIATASRLGDMSY